MTLIIVTEEEAVRQSNQKKVFVCLANLHKGFSLQKTKEITCIIHSYSSHSVTTGNTMDI